MEFMSNNKINFVINPLFATFVTSLHNCQAMHKYLFFCLLFFIFLPLANAQELRLSRNDSKNSICFDLNQLYNYNIYEQNRWGAGLNISIPIQNNPRYGTLFQNRFEASPYFAYGTGDQAWKYGMEVALAFPRDEVKKVLLAYRHDLDKTGQHSFGKYNIFNTIENCTYFSSRYNAVNRLSCGITADIKGPAILEFEVRHSAEQMLYNAATLLFPSRYDTDALPRSCYNEACLRILWGKHWIFDFSGGETHSFSHSTTDDSKLFGRMVAQYSNSYSLQKIGNVRFFAQCGATFADGSDASLGVPLSRRFDLGGTGGSMYYFSNSLLTVRPNSFIADNYLQSSVIYSTAKPLWNIRLSKPTPFFQLNAVWGALRTDKGLGETGTFELLSGNPIPATATVTNNEITLYAPWNGLVETVAGIDYLIHWNLFYMGFAVAYQMTPKNSLYHIDNFYDKFSVMIVAKLVFESEKDRNE